MMFIALLLRPWTIAMDTLGAIPRILADDLLILAWGKHHLQTMREAIDLTHDILQAMGATVAPKKSFIFSNIKKVRSWFSKHIWKGIQDTIPVVTSVRDLGGTISTTKRACAKVIDERITKAIQVLRRFRFLPHSHADKAKFILTKVLPMALYGIECAEPSGHLMWQLQTAIAHALGAHSARACISLVFELHNYTRDLDPHIHQFVRRAMLCRRMLAKHPDHKPTVDMLWQFYNDEQCIGTLLTQEGQGIPSLPAPPPGRPGRAEWKPRKHMPGPVAMLIHSTAQNAAALDGRFCIRRNGLTLIC